MTRPHCSIIIPVHNHASVTRLCLNRLLAEPPAAVDCDITVVDDGSTDRTAQLLSSYGERISVVTHATNEGFATSCNHGAIMACGEYLVFLNNDTIPQRGWLDALVDCARRHPRAGIVGSRLLFPDGTIQHAGVAFTSVGMPTHIYYGFPGDHPVVNKPRRYQAVTGACLLIRRDLFEQLRGFDPTFFNVYEDVDLCLRAGELGYEVHYCPESVVYHLQSVSRAGAVVKDPVKGVQHSQVALWSRWRERVVQDELHFYQEDKLIDISSEAVYPKRVTVSPLVGAIDGSAQWPAVDTLIATRARQVGELLNKNIALDLRVRELELQVLGSTSPGTGRMPLTWPALRASIPMLELRKYIAGLYLEGQGIEVGALHSPVPVDVSVSVRYVDRMTVAQLRRQYPELDALPLIEPDILDNGEHLTAIADASQDFVIASHFLEHCQDPIGTIEAMLRVVRPGGILYVAVPDKRFTFDRNRPVTTLDHLLRDYHEGPEWSRVAHFEEWATMAEDVNVRGRTAQELMDFDYSIHFHVWTQAEVLELFAAMKTRCGFEFDVEAVLKNVIELILILRKPA
ncbi:MAG TPA: glycosyltransferase [Vicinamibacterales bacterium]|nr:glycosyltransferase [Vicinamibacterales bacterium]